jgi:hypothetical protein
LRDVPVNAKRQAQEIIHLLFVLEIELDDVHKIVGAGLPRPYYKALH